ncbi:hypothetical protein ACRS9C_22765 [Serratia marcescens]|uniref:hypothetical protein n=1 Tax=Serratia marcescens TaxID=615 RepID=UPI003EE307C3
MAGASSDKHSGCNGIKNLASATGGSEVIAAESVDIGFSPKSDREIIPGRGTAHPDYLRGLLGDIENMRQGCQGVEDYTLTNNSLDILEHTDVINAETIRVPRNEFRKKVTCGHFGRQL